MKRPSRRRRESATTMLKNGRFLAPPRARRITTMTVSLKNPKDEPWQEDPARRTAHYKLAAHPPWLMTPAPRLLLRPSSADDLRAITEIYGWHVLNGTGTFELGAPDIVEMGRRRANVVGTGLPWLVAERGSDVLGYAYANHFRPRPAYRFCVEDSMYLAPAAAGRGVGRLLLAELLARCEAAGARQMLAVIGDSANAASVAVHR